MPISPIPELLRPETINLTARHGGRMPRMVGDGLEGTGSMPVTA